MHLFRDGLLLPSTIISHCTSVASVLRHWKYDPAADPHIKLFIRAFRMERPVQRRIRPKWDLHLVLSALTSPPFASEFDDRGRISDDVIDLRWRMMKTVFLSALASARRRSYLHALSVACGRCVFGRENTKRQKVMSLLLEAGFLAKYRSSQSGRTRENVMFGPTTQAISKGYGGGVSGSSSIGIEP